MSEAIVAISKHERSHCGDLHFRGTAGVSMAAASGVEVLGSMLLKARV